MSTSSKSQGYDSGRKTRTKAVAKEDEYYDRIRQTYGLSPERFDNMLKEQNGLCFICKKWMDPPNIDHCHITGRVRGLLCKNCNFGLGFFQDNIRFLAQAILYLEGHSFGVLNN